MDFRKVLYGVVSRMEEEGIRYALIGGFAMAMRGIQRATIDLDFILMLEDLDHVDAIFLKNGYRRIFRSRNVSHYQAPEREWGRIDLLHAFRGPSLGMLQRADLMEVESGLTLRVARVEDLIGLKIQALVNDPTRAEGDWADIRLMVRNAGTGGILLDWNLIQDYLEIFNLGEVLVSLQRLYGTSVG